MATKLTLFVLLSMIAVLPAAPIDSDDELSPKRIRLTVEDSSDSEAENTAERSRNSAPGRMSDVSNIESIPDEVLSQRTAARERPQPTLSSPASSTSDDTISADISNRDSNSDSAESLVDDHSSRSPEEIMSAPAYNSDTDAVVPTGDIHRPDSTSQQRVPVAVVKPMRSRQIQSSSSRSYTHHFIDNILSTRPAESQLESDSRSSSVGYLAFESNADSEVPDVNPRRITIPDSPDVQRVPSNRASPSILIENLSESEHSPEHAPSEDSFFERLSDGLLTPMSSVGSIPESIRSSEVSWSNYLEIPRPAENFQSSNPTSSGVRVLSDEAGPSHSEITENSHPGSLNSAAIKLPLIGKLLSPNDVDKLLQKSMQPGSHDSDSVPMDQKSVDSGSDTMSDDRAWSANSENGEIELLEEEHIQAIVESAKKPHPVTLYGRETSLQELFDYETVNEQNKYHAVRKHMPLIKYSDRSEAFEIDAPASEHLDTALNGVQYIERSFIRRVEPPVYRPSLLEPSTSQNIVQSEILRNSLEAVANEMLDGKQRFIAIMGNEGTGKTVLLKKMAQYLRENPANIWPIYLDLDQVNFDNIGTDWGSEHIFKNVLSRDNLKLFQQVLKYNPSKVYMLLDNIDRIPLERINQLSIFINSINSAGTKIIATTTEYLDFIRLINKITILIAPLSHLEIVQFLRYNWESKIGPNSLINDYSSILTKNLIDESNIPRNFYVMKAICKIFESAYNSERSSENSQIFVDNTENNFISLQEYINRGISDPEKISTMLKAIQLDKYNFYRYLIQSMPRTGTFDPFAYGSIALNRILISKIGQSCASNQAVCSYIRYILTSDESDGVKRLWEKPQYIYSIFSEPEIENFFAARYVTHELMLSVDTSNLLDVARYILQKTELHTLTEYFNSDKKPEVLRKLCQLVRTDLNSAKEAIQNAIIHGFDDIASTLFQEFNGQGQIPSLEYTFTRDSWEKILQSKMKKTILSPNRFFGLAHSNIEFPNEFDLLKSLSQPNPSVEIYQLLKNQLLMSRKTEKIPTFYANNLLYEVIKNSGLQRLDIIRDLMINGAQPSTDAAISEKIILLAVKKRDPQLLRYLVEEMNLPIVHKKASILINILDANPFSYCSMPRFWETMEYLIATAGDNIKIPSPKYLLAAGRDSRVHVPAELVSSSAYNLLVGNEVPTDNIVNVKSLSAPLEKFPPELQHMRRHLVLDEALSKNCLTEILLKYRGTDTLTQEEQTAYERSISKALERDFRQNALNHDAEKNIVKLLTDNMATEVDAVFTRNLLSQLLSRSSNSNQLKGVINDNFQREVTFSPDGIGRNPFQSVALKTRAQIYSHSTPETIKSLRREIMESLHQAPCLGFSRRRRRSILNCLISEKEYNTFVKVDNDHGKRRKILDTEKFMKILSIAEFSDRPKYKQLIKMGRHLLEDERARLTGEDMEDFREKILPNSLEKNFKSQKYVKSNNNLDKPARVKSADGYLDIWKSHLPEPVSPLIHGSPAEHRLPYLPSNHFNSESKFGKHIIAPNSEIMAPQKVIEGPTMTQELISPHIIAPIQRSNGFYGSRFNVPHLDVFKPAPKINIPHIEYGIPLEITPVLPRIKYG